MGGSAATPSPNNSHSFTHPVLDSPPGDTPRAKQHEAINARQHHIERRHPVKIVHITTGADAQSHVEVLAPEFTEMDGRRSKPQPVSTFTFMKREEGSFLDFHPAPQRQYMIYLTATVEIGCGDGTKIIMEPGDVLMAEDTTGQGHTSRVLTGGICAVAPFA